MCAMKFSHELRYAAPADDVHAMLTEQEFRERVCDANRAVAHRVEVTPTGDRTRVVVDQTLQTKGIPSFAAKFVGDRIQIVQTEQWTSPTDADLEVTIPGKPGQLRGTITLEENGGETVQRLSGDLKVSIPLVGGKLEELIGGFLASALRHEHRVGQAWLADGA